ncbi:MAG: transcriptional repressor [Patescibacteria group bacterium]
MTKGLHDCSEELRQVELKVTPARLAVLDVLEKTNKPIDIATIIDYLEANDIKTDPATVFRIINSFTNKGITKQIQLNEGKFRYEHASKKDHHHLTCENCGRIEDISDNFITDIEGKIKRNKKFLVKRHSVEFFGICKQCQR